jgi:MFS family permease
MIRKLLGYPQQLPVELKRNFVHLYWDIGWWGIYMGTTSAFLSIYAARSGATREQLGLLTAIPALVSLVLSLPAGWMTRRMGAHRATIVAALASRVPLVFYAVLPWVFPAKIQVAAVLVIAVLLSLPTSLIGVSFGQFFMDGVPSRYRGNVVGMRIAIMSILSFAVTMVSGQILTYVPFPRGYQIIFLAGAIGASMTAYHIWRTQRVPDPDQPPVAAPDPKQRLLPAWTQAGQSYVRVLGLLFIFNFTNNMFVPLVPDLLVNGLHLSDRTISLGTGLANMLVFLVSLFIARITRRTGNRRATAYGAILLTLHAIALAFAHDTALYFLAVVVGGLGSGILGASQYNYNLDHVPQVDRSTWLGINLLTGNAAVLLGALSGPVLAALLGTQSSFLLFGALRLAIGLGILRWGEKNNNVRAAPALP